MAQARRRTYAISIYDPNNELDWNEDRNDLEDVLIKQYHNKYKPRYKYNINKVLDLDNKILDEAIWSQMKSTPSRLRMIAEGIKLNNPKLTKISTVTTKQDRFPNVGVIEFNNKRYDNKGTKYENYRLISPREAYMLMGFTEKQYYLAREDMIKTTKLNRLNSYAYNDVELTSGAREKLYKQAGNSIAVNVLEEIFYYIKEFENE